MSKKLFDNNEAKPTFNHAFTFGFVISGSTDPKGKSISAAEFRAAIKKALREIGDTELETNCGLPFDTFEE